MKPFLGQPVIVPLNPDTNGGAEEAYAIVSRVWSDDNVSVRVFGDRNDVEWRTGLTLLAQCPEKIEDRTQSVCWVHPGTSEADPADEDLYEPPLTFSEGNNVNG